MPEEDQVFWGRGSVCKTVDEWTTRRNATFSDDGRGPHVVDRVRADIRASKFRATLRPT